MNNLALVRSPLKMSGSSPMAFMSWAWGTGRRLAGRFGLAGTGSGPPGGPPGGPPAPSPPPGGPPGLSPPPRGPPPPWNGLHSGGCGSSPSVHLNTLLKLVASLVLTSELVWVTMVGGSYSRVKHAFQVGLGAGKGVFQMVGLCLICLLRTLWSESSID